MRSLLALLIFSCPATAGPVDMTLEDFGRVLFFSPALSVTGTQSCSSCHDPAAGFSGQAVIEGAVPGRFGNRKPPSIAYQGLAPVFHHTYADDINGEEPGKLLTFVGGAFLDGRARGDVTGTALGDQAQMPFLNAQEMAMPSPACVVLRACQVTGGMDPALCEAVMAADFDAVCSDPAAKIKLFGPLKTKVEAGFAHIARALAAFERSPEVNRFTSRFDDWQSGKGELTAQELAGFEVFTGKGQCSVCHSAAQGAEGEPPLFTNFTYANIGLPRNPENPWYSEPSNAAGADWVDEGLSVTLLEDRLYTKFALGAKGEFKVPTVRNVDARSGPDGKRNYGHNGYFDTLEGIVHFYNTRDKLPRCASPKLPVAEALAQNCWPEPEVSQTVNTLKTGNLQLSLQEEAALVAFLKTLTDR